MHKIEFQEVISEQAKIKIRTKEAECPNGHSGCCTQTARQTTFKTHLAVCQCPDVGPKMFRDILGSKSPSVRVSRQALTVSRHYVI